ncbi:hypothetical protein [Thioalkalivibrio sp.]|uniref:hypothetical protein n=1 Tax=Thioalkalivibrio sp. TaxID=2093813 RepID=UPI0035683B67
MNDTNTTSELQQATAWAEDVRDRRESINRRADAFQREHDELIAQRAALVGERESALREFALVRDELQTTKGEHSAAVSAIETAQRASLKQRVRARAKELENTPAPRRYATLRTEFDVTQPHLENLLGRTML